MDKEQLKREIKKRSPWYQRISFEEYGITTTDDVEDCHMSTAPDNRIGGLSATEASQMRPIPKWDNIKGFLPDLTDLDVLEIGSNNGFFSFEFAKSGANSVTGIDVNKKWLNNAVWCKSVLNMDNVNFIHADFMLFDESKKETPMLNDSFGEIPLPLNEYDLIFSSTVINHMFFPMLAIYKMLKMANKYVIIDFPILPENDENTNKVRLDVSDGYHAYIFSKEFLLAILKRLGVPEEDIKEHYYNNGLAITLVIDVQNMQGALKGA